MEIKGQQVLCLANGRYNLFIYSLIICGILTDQFVSTWYNDIENSSRGQLYGPLKKDWIRKLFSEIKREN
jgi:hypothetical protein